MQTALPDYHIRQSPKAKNLRLKVTREEGLLVVVPKGYDENKIPTLLKQKKVWIIEALKRIGETRRFLESRPTRHLPEAVHLVALGETWPIIYREEESRSGVWLRTENGKLIISGSGLSQESVIRKLKDWLRGKVREGLFPIMGTLAAKHHFKLSGLLVKSQRTRWASCSARRNLALNTKLLFLSPDLVRYVLIHELCHTVHMNHTKEFWRLVQAHEPCYKVLDEKLRGAWKTVPQWMLSRPEMSTNRSSAK
jgi:predicted metal-dependent hydrolase